MHDQRSGDTEATVEIIGHRIENVRIARAEIQKIAFPKISLKRSCSRARPKPGRRRFHKMLKDASAGSLRSGLEINHSKIKIKNFINLALVQIA